MKPNLFLFYVTDIKRSTKFYSELFALDPMKVTEGYVSFEIVAGIQFALWSARSENLKSSTPRTSELVFALAKSATEIDELFKQWQNKATAIVEEPHDEVFGRTFVIADPDGNLIRVSPL